MPRGGGTGFAPRLQQRDPAGDEEELCLSSTTWISPAHPQEGETLLKI